MSKITTYSPSESKVATLKHPQGWNGMLGYTQQKEGRVLIITENFGRGCEREKPQCLRTEEAQSSLPWSDRPYMLMLGWPNSCCGSREAPLLLHPPSSQAAPHPLWTFNNKALINKVYFPGWQDGPEPLFVPGPTQQHVCWQTHRVTSSRLVKMFPSLSPLFLQRPLRQNFPPCLRATSEMSQRCEELRNYPDSNPGFPPLWGGRRVANTGSVGDKVLVCGWHGVTAGGDMLLQRRCNKCDSGFAQQKQENSPQLLSPPEQSRGGG